MGFLQLGINNKPLKQQDKRKLGFSEFGIVKQPEPPKSDGSRALEIAKRLGQGKHELDHEFLVEHFGR